VLHVFSSIRDEQGLDRSKYGETLRILEEIAKNINDHEVQEPWPVEGKIIAPDKRVATRNQMIQHYKAVMHLLQRRSDQPERFASFIRFCCI